MKVLRIVLATLIGLSGICLIGWTLMINAKFTVIVNDLGIHGSTFGYITSPASIQLAVGVVVVSSLCWAILKVKPAWISIAIFLFSGLIYCQHVYFLQYSALSLTDRIVDGVNQHGEQAASADSASAEPAGP